LEFGENKAKEALLALVLHTFALGRPFDALVIDIFFFNHLHLLGRFPNN
jgi:hypothetical protein